MYNSFNQPYYNPSLENQINRLSQIQQSYSQSYPQYGQNFNQPQQPNTPTKIINPVASLEEVKAYTPNFNGSKSYFEEVATGTIYVKYLGLNGMPILDVYKKVEPPAPNESDYISRAEFQEIKDKFEQYESILKELLGGDTNATNESNAINANAKKWTNESNATNGNV